MAVFPVWAARWSASTAADYSAKHEAMVNAIHAALPNAAVMLVSPMGPNLETISLAFLGMLFPQY